MKSKLKILFNIPLVLFYSIILHSQTNNISKLEKKVAKWLNTPSVSLKEIQGGLTNKSYLGTSTKIDNFVVRIGKNNPESLGINRYCEQACNQSAGKIGISPKILYCNPHKGILISSFIKGENLSTEKINISNQIEKIIQVIKKCHSIPFRKEFLSESIYAKIRKMINLSLTFKESFLSKQDAKESLGFLDKIESYFYEKEKKYEGLCHCDLFPENFIDDGNHLWLIDWEYACWGNILFDLASLCTELNIDEQKTEEFLKLYFETTWQSNYFDFKLMCAIFNLRNAFWYEIRSQEIQELGGYNMKEYALKHYKSFKEEIAKLLSSNSKTINPNDLSKVLP